jgi:hypothetical protein
MIDYDNGPKTVQIHCTDKDKWFEADVINHNKKHIVMTILEGQVRLSFRLLKKKGLNEIYVANQDGYEFVYQSSL